jgi:exodeoxyribonuclease VII small subunit
MKESKPDVESMTFEEAFAALGKIVQVLETSDATLADSLSLFEQGQKLSQHCSQLLKEADLKLQTIQEASGNSTVRSKHDLE